jgi:hypothetical protein
MRRGEEERGRWGVWEKGRVGEGESGRRGEKTKDKSKKIKVKSL